MLTTIIDQSSHHLDHHDDLVHDHDFDDGSGGFDDICGGFGDDHDYLMMMVVVLMMINI